MKNLWLCLLMIAGSAFGQTPQPTPYLPFQLNVRVVYPGEKARPDYAAFIYKALREVPNVVLVNENPDAILMIAETSNGKQYGCSFIVLCPATPDVKREVEVAIATAPQSDDPNDMLWARLLQKDIHGLKPMYYWGNVWTIINDSPKAALTNAIKLFDVQFVEKERRADEDAKRYLKEHPFTPPPSIRDPTPTSMATPKPTPLNLTMPRQAFGLARPTPAPEPIQLLGPDPLAAKP